MPGPASSDGRACTLEIFVFSKSQQERIWAALGPLSDGINNSQYMSDLEFWNMRLIMKPTKIEEYEDQGIFIYERKEKSE